MNDRNYFIHGNVDPIRDKIETVYFEGKHPIFVDCGDVMDKVFENAERVYGPKRVVSDYESVHLMLIDLMNLLEQGYKSFFLQVIGDAHPGYEIRLKRVTRVLPDHAVSLMMPGMRFDDELDGGS